MGWSIVNSATVAGAASITISSTASRNLLVAVCQNFEPTDINGITDNAGNRWSKATSLLSVGVGATVAIWYAKFCKAGTTSVTETGVTAAFNFMSVYEVSTGDNTQLAIDATATFSGASGGNPNSPAVATNVTGDFIVAGAVVGTDITKQLAGDDFTLDFLPNLGAFATSHLTSNSAAIGSYTSNWDNGNVNCNMVSVIASFKPRKFWVRPA